MIDKKELVELYEDYKAGCSKSYNQLFILIINFSNFMLLKWCKTLNLSLKDIELYDLSIEVSVKIMTKVYNKEPIKDFSGLVYYTSSNVLRDRKNRLLKQNNSISFEDYLRIEGKNNDSENM